MLMLALLLSCLFFVSEAKCSLRLTLLDSYGDGFNGNSLTLTTNGKTLALTPVSGLASVNADGSATLTGGSVGAFQFYTEAGDSVSFDYEYSLYPSENSWRVELFDAYAPFGSVVLAVSKFSTTNIPTCVDIGTVICGPLPAAISNVIVTPGVYAQEVKIDWPSVAVSDTDNSVVYMVSFRDIADSNPNNWILLAQPSSVSEVSAVFPPGKTFQIQIVAVNQYGASQPYLLTYTTPAYATSSVFVKLFDSAQNGWGAYDGFVFVLLGNFAYGSLTFPCASGSICTEILYEVKVPAGVAYNAQFVYQAPSSGGSDCSWAVYNSAAAGSNAIFQSGQNAAGPIVNNFALNCNFPGTPTKNSGSSSGTTPSTIPCPSAEPQAGVACTGQTPSGGCAYEASCCCPNEAIAANKACVSNVYTCSGQSNATWQVVVPTAACVSDPTFSCPSDCPSAAPSSKVGQACSAAITCNYPVTCGGVTGCTRTDTYACTGSSTLTWQSSQTCTCTNTTSCAPWENLITSGDCCVTPPSCQTDPSSTVCLNPTDWTPCAANSGTCGAGTQNRTTYTRQTNKQCLSAKGTQTCTIPCPVNCVGSWSNYTTCSVSCGQGVKTRKFTVTTPAANQGTPCQVVDGTVDTAQCDTTSACAAPAVCNYVIDAYDAYGDGWDTAYVKITYTGSPANLTINVPFVSGVTTSKSATKTFAVTKGNVITFQYFIMNEGYPQEASFAVAAGVATSTGAIVRVGNDVLQNPAGLTVDTPPTTTVTLKATCASCANASPAFCGGLNRVTCENAQAGDDLCGMCLSGFTSTSPASGRTACTDIDECVASTNPCGTGAICTNLPGAFNCSCASGYTLFNGACMQGTCPAYRLRKEWTDLTDAEKDRFDRAVIALGKTFWTKTKNAHAAAATDPNNVHADSWFLPWHRGFIDEVEAEFYVLPGDLRCTCIPYWDWTITSEQGSNAQTYLQSKIFTDAKNGTLYTGLGIKSAATWLSDSTHPFKTLDGYRAAYGSLSWSGYGTASIYGGALTQSTYAGLTSFLVNGAHGTLHGWIGGLMGYLNLAAGDPMFFLHHGFLEVLHSSWQSCKGYTNRDNVPAAAWSNSPHPIGQKMPVGLTKSRSWYDLYSNDLLKIKFGTSFLARVTKASTAYCPSGSSSGLFALLEQAAQGKSGASYVIGTPVVHNTTGATYHSVPTEEAADSGLNTNNKKKGGKGRKKVTYNVTKTIKATTDKQNTESNKDVVDIYTEAAETFKKVYKATGDVDQAYSASVDVECSIKNYTSELTTSLSMIKEMKMERMCAQGLCFHQCYLRQKGRNKDAFKSDYQKKIDAGQEQSYKEWKKSQKKSKAKGTTPTKKAGKPKSAKKSYVEFLDDAPMAQI